ncbi:U4/U6 small nuclear ribonucleoprotein Prp3 [Hondaea fermentalgiana]|uniref:U4/U6 small nuclear ribonucleoprotein Prp3 n=1 Tax=Hondaea fermentalgiana TaxID=2315210 RepID=A0A2R5GW19_9STRA|nr:U4/U6 small nuclear ribonucleoprotein Prp3 [Hondaea fermentalgiana]|eukprot:GBG34765.1 U4/U6 small nuclear ribonucleoprotein Prp3 [Hondaea fermentalgiana]
MPASGKREAAEDAAAAAAAAPSAAKRARLASGEAGEADVVSQDGAGAAGAAGAGAGAVPQALSAEEARAKAEALRQQMELLRQQKLAKKKLKKTKRKLEASHSQQQQQQQKEQQTGAKSETELAPSSSSSPPPPTSSPGGKRKSTAAPDTVPESKKHRGGNNVESAPRAATASTRNPYLTYADDEQDNQLAGIEPGESAEDVARDWERRRARKQKKAFQIVPQGKYIEEAKAQREHEARREYIKNRRDLDKRRHFRQLLGGQSTTSQKTNATSGPAKSENAMDTSEDARTSLVQRAPPPEMEWWDRKVVSRRRLVNLAQQKEKNTSQTAEDGGTPDESKDEAKTMTEKTDGDSPQDSKREDVDPEDVADADDETDNVQESGTNKDDSRSIEFGYEDLKANAIVTLKLVQHPAHIASIVPSRPAPPIPLYLTKEERKRLRRQTRREKQQELHDRIAAGLIPPPPPKVKMSNMMRVLGEQAVLDPSKMEAEVRRQTQARIRDHEMRNQANKLTPQEKWDKKLRKVAEDSQGPPQVAVYRVSELTEPATVAAGNRFKMDANAQKQLLTGCVVIVPEAVDIGGGEKKKCNLVVVEGGAKRLYQFEKQMLRRIKWDPDGSTGNTCVKVWQGVVSTKTWPRRFEFQEFASASEAKTYLDSLGVGHYWDTALRL